MTPTIDEAQASLAEGRTTSRALVEDCLARAADPAGQGSACFTRLYADSARAAADAMDALRRANRAPSPLAGIPVSIKDLFDVAGEPTPAGSALLADAPPARAHAAIVERLLAAGLVLIGRTAMTEFAFSGLGLNPHHPVPLSPWDRATGRIPGGSSSGAAVSVADGFALGAIGTDTGGSCRIPAAFCGITGFKPTQRRVPRAGCFPLSPSLDSIGPLAARVGCCATLDAVLAGEPDHPLPDLPLSGLRLAFAANMLAFLDEATERAIDRALARLDRAGAAIHHLHVSAFDAIDLAHARGGFAVAEAYAIHRDRLATDRARYDPRVADRIAPGADMPAADYIALTDARAPIIARFAAELAPFDALLMPTVPIVPPPLAAFDADATYRRLNGIVLRNPSVINFLDGCSVSLNCSEPGLPPAGLMLSLPAMADRRLLAVAAAVQEAPLF